MGVDPAIDITTEQRETILALLEEHLPDTAAWIYGSRVKWTSRPQSDLDLVVFATPEQNSRVGALREAFEEGNLPFRVDLFVWDAIPETFKEQIGAEHVVLVETEEQGVRDGWTSIQLGDTVDLLTGFPFKSDKYVNDPSAPRLLRGDNIGQGTLRWDGAKRWPQNETHNLNSYWLRGSDVVIAMDRPWIEAGLKFSAIRESDLPALLVQRVARLRGNSRLNTQFLRYVIGGRDFTNYVLSVQTGTAVPHISARQIKEFEFLLPPLSEQRAIAHILGTVDDKIELNRRMNETLEAMAQALFKSWFVDFDPVRAKMAGGAPGLSKHLADLFPDRLVEYELGEIPESWVIFHLDGLAVQHTKSMIPYAFPEADFEHFSIPAHDKDLLPAIDQGAAIRSNKVIIPPNAVLLSKLNPKIDRVWMPDTPNGHLQICSTEFLVFTARSLASRTLLFSLFRDSAFRTMLQSMVTGTSSSHQRVSPKALKRKKVLSGTPLLFERFADLAAPMLARVVKNRAESRNLASLRDTLLPKLVSGKLRVIDNTKADVAR